ncbi:uncharacterized protein NECHADRAFT_56534 [Fusarium vanettenii 77-13-4]|uniref:Zn(2)-C6 fungal-type domain-containing protein n=1 Tax=Fusarium vanettenii (strain ATCC MYA-4622 / CBS 123669 / FGSC 9596 / NRRL 45880 / 77-13-4) TaxID=660122 RepID=C7ZR29_FUSV7|nr:uncharacterized protein NECHADRAFT_56534 [Fusarium vanettenii 77-13-4]EEU33525.1 hypothetical protein NECHADRAFT_56534 [Fusarium vanettenii 77-13-4]
MGKRLRACEACHNLKAKCEPSINDPSVCERCTRSNLICVPAARRWQRDRIAELEEQVKNLQERLETAESSAYRHGTSTVTTPVPSGSTCLAFVDAHLDHESQIRSLEACSIAVRSFWPIIPTLSGSSTRSWLESLRTETPIKLAAMFAFTLSPTSTTIDSQSQDELRTRLLEILGLVAVGLEKPSHDLIQAALVAGLWTKPSLDGKHANSTQLVTLAQDLALDFGLGRPSIRSSPAAWFFRLQGDPTLEMQQTWLASWMASTMTAIGLRRVHALDWGLSHQDALHALEEDHLDPLFLEILYTVRLHAEVANALELCHLHSFHGIESDIVRATQADARGRLDQLGSRRLAKHPQLRFLRTLVIIYVNEPVLHTETNKMLFGAPYLAERIDVDEFARPPEVTRAAEVALRSLVEACHIVIELVLNMEPGFILDQPSLWFGPAVSYALSVLVKTFVAVTAPGNTYGQVLSRDTIRIREAVTNLMVVNSSLLKLDPYMGNWNTRIIGSVEWLGTWLDDYEAVIERYEANLQREVAESAIGSLSHNRHL